MNRLCYSRNTHEYKKSLLDNNIHPIEDEIKSLCRLIQWDDSYNDGNGYIQTYYDDNKIHIYDDYKLKSYDEIINDYGRCMWLDVCNLFKPIAHKYDLEYSIIMYTIKSNIEGIIHQEVDFIITLPTNYLFATYNSDSLFTFYKKSIHNNDMIIDMDEVAIELSLKGNLYNINTDITNMKLYGMKLSEFNKLNNL